MTDIAHAALQLDKLIAEMNKSTYKSSYEVELLDLANAARMALDTAYLVVWRGTEDNFMTSQIRLPADTDPKSLSNGEWVVRAAMSEGYSVQDATALIESSYDFILACEMPSEFYGSN